MPSFQTDVNFSRVSSEPAGDKQHQCAARQPGAQNAGKGQLHAGEGEWRPTRANFFGSQDIVAPKAKEFALDVRANLCWMCVTNFVDASPCLWLTLFLPLSLVLLLLPSPLFYPVCSGKELGVNESIH
jgi:hypothetical protein